MPSPIASVLSAQGGRYGSNSGAKAKSSRITMFGNTATPSAAPTAGTSNSQGGAATGYVGVPTAEPYAPIVDWRPQPQPRPIGQLPAPVVPPAPIGPPGVGVGTGVGPVEPPPSGQPPSGDPNRYVGPGTSPPPVGIGVAPVAPVSLSDAVRGSAGTSPGAPNGGPTSTTGPGRPGANTPPTPPSGRRGGLGPSNRLPGAPYSTLDVTPPPGPGSGLGNPGGGGGAPPPGTGTGNPINPGAGRDVGTGTGYTDPQPPVETELQRAIREAQGRSPGDATGAPTSTTYNQPKMTLPDIVGQLLPGEQAYYDNQIARRSRGLFDTAEAKTNYGLERLEDRGMGQSSVAGNVAAENFGQYVRDADAAAADVQAKQFSSREQRMADARKFEFDKALQAAQYALAQKDENGQSDEQQLQAALAMFGQAFGQGGYAGLYRNQYQQPGR